MKRQKGELREVATESKARLGGGFWQGNDVTKAREFIKREEPADDFEKRVMDLLAIKHPNPVQVMLDKEHIETLEGADKERYVMELSTRVQDIITKSKLKGVN